MRYGTPEDRTFLQKLNCQNAVKILYISSFLILFVWIRPPWSGSLQFYRRLNKKNVRKIKVFLTTKMLWWDPDPAGSVIKWPLGSGSGFVIRIYGSEDPDQYYPVNHVTGSAATAAGSTAGLATAAASTSATAAAAATTDESSSGSVWEQTEVSSHNSNNQWSLTSSTGTKPGALDSSVSDPDPGSGAFLALDPGSGMGRKSRSRYGMNIQDHISKSLKIFLG